jgi:exopolysaccharide biosynthesis protein
MKALIFCNILLIVILPLVSTSQIEWENVDSLYAPLPGTVHVYKTTDSLDGKPNIACYIRIPLKVRNLIFDADTTRNRRITPSEYYQRNNKPLVVVNCTFFLQDNSNANVVVDQKKMVSFNIPSFYSRSDSVYYYTSRSAIGINRKGKADVAWIYTDTKKNKPFQVKQGPLVCKGRKVNTTLKEIRQNCLSGNKKLIKTWKMVTAVGGGPTLISDGAIRITNEEEKMFTGRAINDRHPRTAMGYTSDGYLIIQVIQGRFPGIAEGATLGQEAKMLKELGCYEALNLDGGGSSCLLINGKETITPCDKTGQRPVPAVFLVKTK